MSCIAPITRYGDIISVHLAQFMVSDFLDWIQDNGEKEGWMVMPLRGCPPGQTKASRIFTYMFPIFIRILNLVDGAIAR